MNELQGDALELELLQRRYLQMEDPEELQLPSKQILRNPENQSFIFNHMFNRPLPLFSPPHRYQFRVLKKLLTLLEDAVEDPEQDEISNDLASYFAELLAEPMPSELEASRNKCYVTYTVPTSYADAPTITILESPSLMSSAGTTGFRVWDASLYLATCLTSPGLKGMVQGKTILEIGAGLGFLSLFCMKHLNARGVHITDGTPEVIENAQENVRLNGLSENALIQTTVLKWGNETEFHLQGANGTPLSYDLVLGADMIYDASSVPSLISTLQQLFAKNANVKTLIATVVRNETTLETFTDACKAANFSVNLIDSPKVPERQQLGFFHSTFAPIHLYMITKPMERPATPLEVTADFTDM